MDQTDEFDYLKNYLEAYGLYERGMRVDDMKNVQKAILESMSDSGLDVDMEVALKESEDEFMQEMIHNSTMVRDDRNQCNQPMFCSDGNNNNSESTTDLNNCSNNAIVVESGYSTESARNISPPSSPDNPQTISVFAQVHHELNYDPEADTGYC